MLPFLNSRAQTTASPENLRANGHLTLDQFALEPLAVRHLQGNLKIGAATSRLQMRAASFTAGRSAAPSMLI
jgi:hypothetical protein